MQKHYSFQKMELIASKFARDKRHADCDSCVVVVLTHGDDGHLIGMDEEHVDIHDFVERFNARLAPGLAGKPKIFIFQACRGGKFSISGLIPSLSSLDKRDYGTEEVVVNWTREDMRRLSATQRLEQQQWATSSSSAYQTLKTNPIQIGYGLVCSITYGKCIAACIDGQRSRRARCLLNNPEIRFVSKPNPGITVCSSNL